MSDQNRPLTEDNERRIDRAIAEYFLLEKFRIHSSRSDFRRVLGDYTKKFVEVTSGPPISIEELEAYIQHKLPKILAQMFGYSGCGITFRP